MNRYLEVTDCIDWKDPAVMRVSSKLAEGANDSVSIARNCFLFVRDEIRHCWDYQLEAVTYRASEVLCHRTGWCYAKSHLLAALLRANGIPAGLCYQRLSISDEGAPFSLHGLNAIYLEELGWYRVDARGDKQGIQTSFDPPHENLAFPITLEGERDLPEIWADPHPAVTVCLTGWQSNTDIFNHLPDVTLL